MKLEYLGNEFDQMKGAVLGELQQKELLSGLVVDSMTRYDEPWADHDLAHYADILSLPGPEQIARHQEPWGKGKRSSYFAELSRQACEDVFLDPDVGVTTSSVEPRYVKPCEVLGLVQNGNVVAVYQHGCRYSIERRIAEVVEALQRLQPSVECLAYMERQAAMLFLAVRPHRLGNIAECLGQPAFAGSQRTFPARCFLTRVKLLNYKSIATCDVPLRQISFLVGPNGSGKSNFLDALRFISDALNLSLDHALRARGGVDLVQRRPRRGDETFGLRVQMELAASFGWYALAVGARGEEGYEICREECHLVQRENGRKHFFRAEHGQMVATSVLRAPPAVADSLYLLTASEFKEFRPAFDALARMQFTNPVPDRISNIASALDGVTMRSPRVRERVDEYLGSIVPSWSETTDFLRENSNYAAPFSLPVSMSDGTLRMLRILLALFQSTIEDEPERHFVGIEEPEAVLYPSAAEVLLDAIREAALRVQVLVTSHSTELLEGTPVDSIIAVSSDQQGTRLGNLDEVSRSAIRDGLFTAGELLRMDQLGMTDIDGQPPTMVDHLFSAES